MGKVYIAIASAVVIALAVTLFLRLKAGDSGSNSKPGSTATDRDGPGGSSSADRPRLPGQPGDSATDRDRPAMPPLPTVASRKVGSYPPTSQPLVATNRALIQPNVPVAVAKPTSPPSDPNGEPTYTYLFTANRIVAIGDDEVTFTLAVSQGTGATRVPAKISTTSISLTLRGRTTQVGKKLLRDDGQYGDASADDLIYTAVVAPSELQRYQDIAGTYALEVAFEDPAGAMVTTSQSFFYTPEADIPARFTGKIKEAVDKGSLVISAQVAVAKPGHYIIRANLYGANNAPVAHALAQPNLEAGAQWVELLFFGKLLRDSGIAGPYSLRDLRGHLRVEGEAIGREMMRDFDGQYETRPYRLEDFSASPWSSGD